MSLMARKHNGFGTGFKVSAANTLIFKEYADYKWAVPVQARPKGLVSVYRNIGLLTLDFLGGHDRATTFIILMKIGFPVVAPLGVDVTPLFPSVLLLDAAGCNPKANVDSQKAWPGEGENHPNQ